MKQQAGVRFKEGRWLSRCINNPESNGRIEKSPALSSRVEANACRRVPYSQPCLDTAHNTDLAFLQLCHSERLSHQKHMRGACHFSLPFPFNFAPFSAFLLEVPAGVSACGFVCPPSAVLLFKPGIGCCNHDWSVTSPSQHWRGHTEGISLLFVHQTVVQIILAHFSSRRMVLGFEKAGCEVGSGLYAVKLSLATHSRCCGLR